VSVVVVGGGLAGCEAAWALAERGKAVTLVEMRPHVGTPAHRTDPIASFLIFYSSLKNDLILSILILFASNPNAAVSMPMLIPSSCG